MQFNIGNDKFMVRQMSGLDQIEVVSRLMSVGEALKEILPKAMEFAFSEKGAKALAEGAAPTDPAAAAVDMANPLKAEATIKKAEALWGLVGPVAKAIAKMSSEDKAFVIKTCMKLIDKAEEGDRGWSPIYDPDSDRFMFREYANDGAFQLTATLRVIGASMGPFFRTFLQGFGRL